MKRIQQFFLKTIPSKIDGYINIFMKWSYSDLIYNNIQKEIRLIVN